MSSYFEWDANRYSLKISAMDDEHKVLIGLMNKLHSLHDAGARGAVLLEALADLARYTEKHFADEEAYMAKVGYPNLGTHKVVHERLLDRLAALHESCAATGKLSDDLFVFLKTWLSGHICGVDTKYAAHALAQRAG
jgi:hemerythrin-like metal-binding protein